MRGSLAFRIFITLAAAARVALAEIQIQAEWDAQTQEQNAAVQNPIALGQGVSSSLSDVYYAAGVPAVPSPPVAINGQLVPLSGPAPPPPPPGSAPPPPGYTGKTPAPAASSGLGTSDTVLVVAGIGLGVVGLLCCAWYGCSWRGISAGPRLPPVIPYRIPGPAGYTPVPPGYTPAPSGYTPHPSEYNPAPSAPDYGSVHVFKVPTAGY